MTSSVTMSDINGANSVDFNTAGTKACNVRVSHRSSNPVLTMIDTPIETGNLGSNTIAVNLGMVTNAFDLTFDLYDGPGTFEFYTPSTDYEKIIHMANYDLSVKKLTLNGTVFWGQIENVRVTWDAGKKDLAINCSLTFHLTKFLSME